MGDPVLGNPRTQRWQETPTPYLLSTMKALLFVRDKKGVIGLATGNCLANLAEYIGPGQIKTR